MGKKKEEEQDKRFNVVKIGIEGAYIIELQSTEQTLGELYAGAEFIHKKFVRQKQKKRSYYG